MCQLLWGKKAFCSFSEVQILPSLCKNSGVKRHTTLKSRDELKDLSEGMNIISHLKVLYYCKVGVATPISVINAEVSFDVQISHIFS